jgi:hypothetical protein
LLAQDQPAPSGPVFVLKSPSGFRQSASLSVSLAQQFWTVLGGEIGQLRFGVRAGVGVNPAGQLPQKSPDHLHVCGIDGPGTLPGGGGGQLRGQWLAGNRLSGAQVSGFVDATAGLGAGDAQAVSQHMGQRAADLTRSGLTAHSVDQLVAGYRQPPGFLLEAFQQR